MTTNCISSSSFSFITLLKKSIPLYSPSITNTRHLHLHLHLHASSLSLPSSSYTCPTLILLPQALSSTLTASALAMCTFTTPPEFPTRRTQEVETTTPREIPQIPSEPEVFTVPSTPEINPSIPPTEPIPIPPGPETPKPPIPSPPGPEIVPPPGPEIVPPPGAPPPRQPPDVIPPPNVVPPPLTPPPDITPPTGPLVV